MKHLVHMLSSSAFNAFLKTLEEPPPYAIFILATTEKHKILPTILSRCQIFDFKRITIQDTVDHLKNIAKKENVQTDEAGLQLIAQKSEGCMRDALSILDKIVSFTGGNVTYTTTLDHLNILDADYYFKLIDCMLSQDLAGAMLLYDDIDKKGFEGDMVLNGFAEFTRNLLICKDERVVGLLEVVDSFKQRYLETAKKIDAGYLVSALNILSESEINYKMARNKRLHVELALIKLCYLQQALEVTANDNTIDKKKLTETAKPLAFKTITPIASKSTPKNISETINPPAPIINEPKLIIETEKEIKLPVVAEEKAAYEPQPVNGRSKLSSLDNIRAKLKQTNGSTIVVEDEALDIQKLEIAWKKLVQHFKENKNPAWQSFELAKLVIKDANSFDATAANNLQQKFLELERNKACEFLQKELGIRKLKFSVVLIESDENLQQVDIPLSSKEQYQKIIEQFPLVKELKERLKLDLDY